MPPRTDFTLQRLFVDQPMEEGGRLALDRQQANYLVNVLRMRQGARVLVFNGREGEWLATISEIQKKSTVLTVSSQTRAQTQAGDIWLCFAPIKSARLDYMIQKAVEMGASRLIPVITHRTQVTRLNLERMRSNVIEAAEQCGILNLPDVAEEIRLTPLLAGLDHARTVLFCDEAADVANPLLALQSLKAGQPVALLIGPEGGFDESERQLVMAHSGSRAIALGPRILRADTAAVAALTALQIAVGDWND
jgi:16S rRNA (uracil1498-N3)-methyltransferase